MRGRTIAGLIAVLVVGTAVLLAAAPPSAPGQETAGDRPSHWPATKGRPVVHEWYSDLPWTQKLGTYRGNEIDEPIVLPYGVLGDTEKQFCTNQKLTDEACMLEVGIVNVLGTLRTDTPYDPEKVQAAPECTKDPSLPCIEVKLELSSFRTLGSSSVLKPRLFGVELPDAGYPDRYTITDGNTYAPQMPWYMAHYCDSSFGQGQGDVQDPVCYGDYVSPMNNGFNATGLAATAWPKSNQPWSVSPFATVRTPPPPSNHCKDGETTCTLVMAGFDLREVPMDRGQLQYKKYNNFLLTWFNGAVKGFTKDFSQAEHDHHFPWNFPSTGEPITWEAFVYPRAVLNPFLGQFDFKTTGPPCEFTADKDGNPNNCAESEQSRATHFLYPRQCSLADLAAGADKVARLRQCGLNYEIHHNGWLEPWGAPLEQDLRAVGMMPANQYGRTSFLFAGVPGLQLPVSFYKDPTSDSGLSVYERVYNASIFSLYLPVANVADRTRALLGRNYTDKQFYHTLLMTNHMEAEPDLFADGLRGKVLWHNEYRTEKMFESSSAKLNPGPLMFAAAFKPENAKAPFHNNTCDGCHVRNGSGVPINTAGTLDAALQEKGMKGQNYDPYPAKDYTFTGQIRPMKLVLFDLKRTTRRDSSLYSEPLSFSQGSVRKADDDRYYNNKIMNFYGDSFHATTPGHTYSWSYKPADSDRIVVKASRDNSELNKTYVPQLVELGAFQTPSECQLNLPAPTTKPWPSKCDDVNGPAIGGAIGAGDVGYMLLNGKRLGNLSAMEAIPNQAILGFRDEQKTLLGAKIAGEVIWNSGSRDGVGGKVHKDCDAKKDKSLTDCYIGRFGWVGDRVSLEDQVANAAFVEMNMTTSEGYTKLYARDPVKFPIRYNHPNCGPANKTCVESKGNGELSEQDIRRMAEYARWLGNPVRSEFKVSLPEVIAGEKIFRRIKCDTCHVINKIEIDPEDTMLSQLYRARLAKRVEGSIRPFLSYIGTDLLMHDMGYLSQVGNAGKSVRDDDGVVKEGLENYVQKIRTPALKGLRFNRFVTDSHLNTKTPTDPACDFLLHDGRACDAIEAAFLHDGPAIKKLGVIEELKKLLSEDLIALRAFLYSL